MSFFDLLPNFVPFNTLLNIFKKNLIYPFYHTVSNEKLIYADHLINTKNVKEFENDINFLLKHYKPIDLSQLLKIAQGEEKNNTPSFFLSFDDGLRACYDTIAPILLRKGVPAAFFINNAFLDNRDIFYRYKINVLINKYLENIANKSIVNKIGEILTKENENYKTPFDLLDLHFNNLTIIEKLAEILSVDFDRFLETYKPYLSTIQVQTLIKQGFYIGAHSINHPLFFTISQENQIEQTKNSIQQTVEQFQLPYRIFAFPFTDAYLPISFFEKIEPFVDITFGTSGLKKDVIKTNFQRISMEQKSMNAKQILKREYTNSIIKKSIGREKIYRN